MPCCMFRIDQESESFLETAPWIFHSEVELDISVDDCYYKILMDDSAWQYWHPEVTNIQWQAEEGRPPHGKTGSKRTIVYNDWLSYLLLGGPVTIEEEYVNCNDDESPTSKEFSVNYTAIGRPPLMMFHAFREKFLVQQIATGRCKFIRTLAVRPSFLNRYTFGCISYPTMKNTLTKKCPDRLKQAILAKQLPRQSDQKMKE